MERQHSFGERKSSQYTHFQSRSPHGSDIILVLSLQDLDHVCRNGCISSVFDVYTALHPDLASYIIQKRSRDALSSFLYSFRNKIHPYFCPLPSAAASVSYPALNGNPLHVAHSPYASRASQTSLALRVESVLCGSFDEENCVGRTSCL